MVLRYLWIDRRDLCADDAERAYFDALERALDQPRATLQDKLGRRALTSPRTAQTEAWALRRTT
jgi:hypothetical protein